MIYDVVITKDNDNMSYINLYKYKEIFPCRIGSFIEDTKDINFKIVELYISMMLHYKIPFPYIVIIGNKKMINNINKNIISEDNIIKKDNINYIRYDGYNSDKFYIFDTKHSDGRYFDGEKTLKYIYAFSKI